MRIKLLGTFLVFLILGTVRYSVVMADNIQRADDQFSGPTAQSTAEISDSSSADRFVIESAS